MIPRYIIALICSTVITTLMACTASPKENTDTPQTQATTTLNLSDLSVAYFAGGCFWCVEVNFEHVKGVKEAISGYTGGSKTNPTYSEVGGGHTRHAEAVAVYYDSTEISYATLLKLFMEGIHDPTTVDGQHPDYGRQYRSGIFYTSSYQEKQIEAYLASAKANKLFKQPIATEIAPFKIFYEAEDYHQDYYPNGSHKGYLNNVTEPKLKKFKKKFPEYIKENWQR